MKKIVMLLHGIRTTGAWQKDAVPILHNNDFDPYLFDYGYFSLFKMGWQPSVDEVAGKFHEWYMNVCQEAACDRPSIIAHSLGTYLLLHAMSHNYDMKFDKVILVGSVLPRECPLLRKLISEGRVNDVRNIVGGRDAPSAFASIMPSIGFSHWFPYGSAGQKGFLMPHPMLSSHSMGLARHSPLSDIMFKRHYIPFLNRKMFFSNASQRYIKECLLVLKDFVADQFNLEGHLLRANLMIPDFTKKVLKVTLLSTENAYNDFEHSLEIPMNAGNAGGAFSSVQTRMVLLKSNNGVYISSNHLKVKKFNQDEFSFNVLPEHILRNVRDDLAWIISIPVYDQNTGIAIGVVNIDGLSEISTNILNDSQSLSLIIKKCSKLIEQDIYVKMSDDIKR